MKNDKISRVIIFLLFLFMHSADTKAQNIQISGMTGNTVKYPNNIALGGKVPDLPFENLLNADIHNSSIAKLKGKIIILEFWATWCGPCYDAIPHLESLIRQFGNSIVVIGISDEPIERLSRFIKNKPGSIYLHSDPKAVFSSYFPHITIPHSILIDQDGTVAAITRPAEITPGIIEKLLKKQTVNVPQKTDDLSFDYRKEYFTVDTSTLSSFQIQPKIPGAMPMTRKYTTKWQGRRVSFINMPVPGLFRTAYDIADVRTIYDGISKDELNSQNSPYIYCIDAVAPSQAELKSFLLNKISSLDLEIKAKVEKREMEVYILTCTNPDLLTKHINNGGNQNEMPGIIKATSYEKKGVTIDDFAKGYIEAFSIGGKPIVNETGLKGLYDFDFSFEPENPSSFKNELQKIGLKLEKGSRFIEVLILYKDNP